MKKVKRSAFKQRYIMTHCPECDNPNREHNIRSGICGHCGAKANKNHVEDEFFGVAEYRAC